MFVELFQIYTEVGYRWSFKISSLSFHKVFFIFFVFFSLCRSDFSDERIAVPLKKKKARNGPQGVVGVVD